MVVGGVINRLGYNDLMKTKPLTFLLALTFLFLFSGSVYGDDFQDSNHIWSVVMPAFTMDMAVL